MKSFVYLAALVAVTACLIGCKKESTPDNALNERVNPSVAMAASNAGEFNNGPYGTVSGNARIYLSEGKHQLAIENFRSSNGPDLKVYLSKEQQPIFFVSLGSLKSTIGNQLYDIPPHVNIKDYNYALIYCQQFKHLFGYATLTF